MKPREHFARAVGRRSRADRHAAPAADPHIGYATVATYETWWRQVLEDIRTWADGEPLRVL